MDFLLTGSGVLLSNMGVYICIYIVTCMCHNVGILYMREAAVHYIGVYMYHSLDKLWVE